MLVIPINQQDREYRGNGYPAPVASFNSRDYLLRTIQLPPQIKGSRCIVKVSGNTLAVYLKPNRNPTVLLITHPTHPIRKLT